MGGELAARTLCQAEVLPLVVRRLWGHLRLPWLTPALTWCPATRQVPGGRTPRGDLLGGCTLAVDLGDPGRCRSTWHGPRSTVRSSGPTRLRCGGASAGRRTFRDVAADLNVNPETLRTWVRDADALPAASGASETTAAELARLRADNARLLTPRSSVSSGYAGCWMSPARATTGG
ncbi:transposase [Streptomyces syringium]|uniref:transposase n=1 Tax=Streptomyces syringium TaxID=76729 RepID=UPI0033F89DB5